jgi:hypothetical protein
MLGIHQSVYVRISPFAIGGFPRQPLMARWKREWSRAPKWQRSWSSLVKYLAKMGQLGGSLCLTIGSPLGFKTSKMESLAKRIYSQPTSPTCVVESHNPGDKILSVQSMLCRKLCTARKPTATVLQLEAPRLNAPLDRPRRRLITPATVLSLVYARL